MINIRKAKPEDAKQIAYINVTSWQSSYKNIIEKEFLDNIPLKQREEGWRKSLDKSKTDYNVYVAEQEKKIIGFVTVRPYRDRKDDTYLEGEIQAFYLLDSMKGQGIGKKLFHAAINDLTNRNMNSLCIWVLADNIPARSFYEAMGGVLFDEKFVIIGNKKYSECAYRYDNLDEI